MSLEETKLHCGILKVIGFDLLGSSFFFFFNYVENLTFFKKNRKISQAYYTRKTKISPISCWKMTKFRREKKKHTDQLMKKMNWFWCWNGGNEPAAPTHQHTPWRMDGKWWGSSFLLGFSSLANHGG
jgi:hypothetical protein